MKLTEAKVRSAKPAERDYQLGDGAGLYLRVRRSGLKTWIIRRRHGGKATIITLGNYPHVSLREARLKAAEYQLKASVGGQTVADLIEMYAQDVARHHKRPELFHGYARRLAEDFPAFCRRRVRDLEPGELVTLIRTYGKRGARSADQLRSTLKTMFGYGVELGWIPTNPAQSITRRAAGYVQTARERVLSDAEIRDVMTWQHRNAPVLRFLLLTGLRISEAQKGHRQGDRWIVPARLAKNGREHWVHLTDTAADQLPLVKCTPTNIQAWLKRRCGRLHIDPAFTPHDLRRTWATRAHDLGVLPHVVERCLNHMLQGVMAVYNRADYEAERIEAAERVEAHIKSLMD